MATMTTSAPVTAKHQRTIDREFFDPQPTGRAELPDPAETIKRLALVSVEILTGTRSIEQIARWVTEDVYRAFAERTMAAMRARIQHGQSTVNRIPVAVVSVHTSEPRDGIVEAVCILTVGPRNRAVCIRLEGLDHRWRASVLALI